MKIVTLNNLHKQNASREAHRDNQCAEVGCEMILPDRRKKYCFTHSNARRRLGMNSWRRKKRIKKAIRPHPKSP